MKKLLIAVAALASTSVYATCQSVYNPMTQEWDYVCTPQPSDPRPPNCHQDYDPMNQTWVTVCD